MALPLLPLLGVVAEFIVGFGARAATRKYGAKAVAEAMKQVLQTYQQHFAHEEELLDEHLYSDIKNNGGGGGFSADGSARTSHFEDHKRLIREIVEELQKMDLNISLLKVT